ncbi:CHAD domain-containing protein [Sneathiella chinensis]|uniref:CHAD domain-containing protein n=1 Tax=Sneathiella chinensis TaxID=349750 RepID=UPI00146DEC64|nr:CHAD domain-containing protein [Sneathiella chinensis]
MQLARLVVTSEQDVEAVARTIFTESQKHLRANFDLFLKTSDAAALMQIRIGLRRLRVAMRVFRSIIHPEVRKKFDREFRYFGSILGEARDMDVFLTDILKEKCPVPAYEAAYQELRLHGEAMRQEEYDLIRRDLSGGRFSALLKEFDAWSDKNWKKKLGKTATRQLDQPIVPFALQVIEDGKAELLNMGEDIMELSTEELHQVRKYVKRCRYHLRFFWSLFESERIAVGYRLLAEMQDILGHVNDVKESLNMLARLGRQVRAELLVDVLNVIAREIVDAGEDIDTNLGQFHTLWRRYEAFNVTEDDLL